MQRADYFTPFNEATLDSMDLDAGSGGPLLLPVQSGAAHPNLMVVGSKEGRVYLLDRDNDNMGQFQSGSDSQIVQSLVGSFNGIYTTPSFFAGKVYISGRGGPIKAFALKNGLLATPPSQTSLTFLSPGANAVVSSQGSTNGILWALQRGSPGVLRAYDATNLSKELYNSSQVATRDALNSVAKFSSPTVANGKVYITGNDTSGPGGKFFIFGRLP